MMLTDGASNCNPPLGILNTLNKYLLQHQDQLNNLNIELTMFGFSHDIDSELLFNIANITNGGFNFIPDASMVGTTFINYISNSLIVNKNKYIIEKIVDDNVFNINKIQFDNLNNDDKYELIRYHTYDVLKNICINSKNKIIPDNMMKLFVKLNDFIKFNINNDTYLLNELFKDFNSSNDQEEQIKKAVSNPKWFKQWGYHYLLSLCTAHKLRKCHNFKDKGVQLYGNKLFFELIEHTSDVFCNLPAPTPSIKTVTNQQLGYSINMSTYVDRSGACIGPKCKIKLFDGTLKQMCELTGYELLFNPTNSSIPSKIKYVVKTKIVNNQIQMCVKDNLIITPWHPINIKTWDNENWEFPNNIFKTFTFNIEYVYNIILEPGEHNNNYSVLIENVQCVTMGHQLTKFNKFNHILKHSFFGTYNVINSFELFKENYNDKIITINNYIVERGIDDKIIDIKLIN